MTVAAPDVSEEIRVFESRKSLLAVEKHPGRWDELVTRGQLGEGKIRNRVRVVSGVTAAAASVWRRVVLEPLGHFSA